IGAVLAILAGGGAFWVVREGIALPGGGDFQPAAPLPDITFVPVDPVVISLGAAGANRLLKMTTQIEVAKNHTSEVVMLMPRILDVINSYLRTVDVAQLQDPTALVRIRAQLLRRIQVVTGEGRVRDLLVTEFVLN
ncbi:MAG: flagellar basal body-associated FliL family protein, partial [Gemmobacter sp.]|nr:flagellar basal body-associated FliL family protein [Gemmobacter sp.]